MDNSQDISPLLNGRVLNLIANSDNLNTLETISKALGSEKRLAILHFLGSHTSSVLEICEALDMTFTTATQHINILERAGIIKTELQPNTRGVKKVCWRAYDKILIQLPILRDESEKMEISMPIGAFSDIQGLPTCGLISETSIIGQLDDPASFFEPDHIYAQMLWFSKGYVEYCFPNHLTPASIFETLELSFEACSEAPLSHPDWPSDITVWINSHEVGTWTSPADFGGVRGALTPIWWGLDAAQYGLLKIWKINKQGSFIDGNHCSDLTLDELNIKPGEVIKVRIGIKPDAHFIGGLTLFGKKFGNYPQDIILRLWCQNKEG